MISLWVLCGSIFLVINPSPQPLRQTLHFIFRGLIAVNVAIVFAIPDSLHERRHRITKMQRHRLACSLDGVVVGVPGVVDAEGGGRLRLATNIPGLEGRPFGAELRERLGLPVSLENDINLAAVGERWLGIARGVDDFAFLSVGTGLGAGLVLRGEPYRGPA